MDIVAIAEELAQALGDVPDLQTFAYSPARITPPAAVVVLPDRIDYDAAMNRGADRANWDLFVFVALADWRSASENLAEYMAGSGVRSVKAALEGHEPKRYDVLRVVSAEVEPYDYAGVQVLGARFTVDIIGAGED